MDIDQDTGEILATAFKPFIRTRYNYNMRAASIETGLVTPEVSRTQQQFAEQSDINTIVKQFGLTGQLPENVRIPESGDYVDAVTDYQTALNMVLQAEEAFGQLPAQIRARFDNDPQRLQEFVEDRSNLEEARALGLAVPAPSDPLPVRVKVIPEDPAPPAPPPPPTK